MTEPEMIQGRPVGPIQLEQIRQLMAAHPDWSRRHLSQQVARLWEWRNARGQLKDMAARTLLLKLEQRGWIILPPRRKTPPNRMRHKQMPELLVPPPASPIREPLACLLFGAAAWQCADRDRYIGWDRQRRSQNLHLVTNNTRFLIMPWAQVRLLASHVLSRISRRLSRDWRHKYGHPIYLLETFVEQDRFGGTAYRAANWVRVGQTKGRTRQDRPDGGWHQAPLKDIYLYPLHSDFRQHLQRDPIQPTD